VLQTVVMTGAIVATFAVLLVSRAAGATGEVAAQVASLVTPLRSWEAGPDAQPIAAPGPTR